MNKHQDFADRDALDEALADHIARQLQADIDHRGAASLAVSGGSTPKGLFARLSALELDWRKVMRLSWRPAWSIRSRRGSIAPFLDMIREWRTRDLGK